MQGGFVAGCKMPFLMVFFIENMIKIIFFYDRYKGLKEVDTLSLHYFLKCNGHKERIRHGKIKS